MCSLGLAVLNILWANFSGHNLTKNILRRNDKCHYVASINGRQGVGSEGYSIAFTQSNLERSGGIWEKAVSEPLLNEKHTVTTFEVLFEVLFEAAEETALLEGGGCCAGTAGPQSCPATKAGRTSETNETNFIFSWREKVLYRETTGTRWMSSEKKTLKQHMSHLGLFIQFSPFIDPFNYDVLRLNHVSLVWFSVESKREAFSQMWLPKLS